MTALKTIIASLFRRSTNRPFDRFEDMPDWLLHDIGVTRDGTKLGPTGLPARPEGNGRA